jgi:hypothetical protein
VVQIQPSAVDSTVDDCVFGDENELDRTTDMAKSVPVLKKIWKTPFPPMKSYEKSG